MEFYKDYLDKWELGHYGEESSLSKNVRTESEQELFLTVVIGLLQTTTDWKKYLSYFGAAASVFFKNPSFAFFYEHPRIRAEIISKMRTDGIPRVNDVEAELFDVFAANIEHNFDVQKEFDGVFLKCLKNTNSYQELYYEYFAYYLRLYLNTLKISESTFSECRTILLLKIQEWGEPTNDQEAFLNSVETFGVRAYNIEEKDAIVKKKGFLFTKNIIIKEKNNVPRVFSLLVEELKKA